ncbi:XRE family transcriptional regulator [Nocardia nova]|uniref:XRE family transcriptional regulator n=1 Tax=Nocardia nova TaxID=37330 RepID=A0A2S6AHR5_9NOCA|nr:helix-turn-helix transcriptional regulator [Nocardia nova]PPJ23148.1 XRE family transcriptional regulator [Nocardia nova]PPJ34758.1 XRE family transcriptional regulator [Nocardia nova]
MKSDSSSILQSVLVERRQVLHLSSQQVAKRANLDHTTYWRIETGTVAKPQVENITAIARALDLSCADLFVLLGWLPSADLPTISPYLQARYSELPAEAHQRIRGYLVALSEQYGVSFDLDPYNPSERTPFI